jgi:hypothetical protein
MYVKKIILLIAWILVSSLGMAQTFSYNYTDPCTGINKTIQVPSNGITVTYYGQINTFQPNDFYSGAFESWSQNVFASFGNNNPCASLVGMPTSVNIAQNTAISFLGIVNSLSALSDMAGGSSNMIGGTVSSVQNSSSSKSKGNSKNKGGTDKPTENSTSTNAQSNGSTGGSSNTGTTSNNGSSTSSSGSSTTQRSPAQGSNETGSTSSGGSGEPGSTAGNGTAGSQTGGSTTGSQTGGSTTGSTAGNGTAGSQTGGSTTGSQTSGSASNSGNVNGGGSGTTAGSGTSGSNNQSTPTSETEAGGKTNLIGGAVGSVQESTAAGSGAAGASNKNGNRPSILASSDFVGFNFKNSDVTVGGKVTGGYSSMRWDGKRSHGISADYTTAIKGPNITGFYAVMNKRRIDLISTSLTIGFERRMTVYGTLAIGQMWTLNKPKNLKALYMLTGSFGQVSGTAFVGTAAIAGGMYDWKVSKRISVKMLCLYVYAPYVSYYNDVLLKSPHVVLPIMGTNIGITKRFKLNVNAGGAWAINESTLNYTIMLGTRMLL